MKTLVRFVSAAAVLGAVLLFAGCTTHTARVKRIEPVPDFTVVKSSTGQELTPAQLAELREAVTNYLRSQELPDRRLYFVKVNFQPETPDGAEEWAIVRIDYFTSRTYTVLASYPGPDDYQPYDYYRYGYYNGYSGYSGFSRYGYYDPFDYNYGNTTRPVPPRDHAKPDKPDDRPKGTHTRWDNAPRNNPERPRGDYVPRTENPERWNRADRGDRGGGYERPSSPGSSSERSYTPPPPPVRSEPPPRAEPTPQVRESSSRVVDQTNEK